MLGLYRIKRVKGRLNYKLALPKNIRILLIFYISLLELVPPEVLPTLETEIDPVNPNVEYKVENILDKKLVRGQLRYLIK
jgi:hypothetical protein